MSRKYQTGHLICFQHALLGHNSRLLKATEGVNKARNKWMRDFEMSLWLLSKSGILKSALTGRPSKAIENGARLHTIVECSPRVDGVTLHLTLLTRGYSF